MGIYSEQSYDMVFWDNSLHHMMDAISDARTGKILFRTRQDRIYRKYMEVKAVP